MNQLPLIFLRRLVLAALSPVLLFTFIARAEKLPLKVYTSADGLATSVIHYAMRDSKGFLWFAGRGGLSRFDGYEFTSYRFTDEETAPLVHRVYESRDGRHLWILTDSGLYRAARAVTESALPVSENLPRGLRRLPAARVSNGAFWSIHETPEGQLLLGSSDGLYAVDDKDAEKVTYRKIEFNRPDAPPTAFGVYEFAGGQDGSVWFVAGTGLVRRVPDGRYLIYEVPLPTKIGEEGYSVRVDRSNRVWFSYRAGLYVLAPEPLADLAALPNITSRALPFTVARPGAAGEIELPAKSGEMIKLEFNDPNARAGQLTTPSIGDIYQTPDGQIWIPAIDGLYLFEGNAYRRLRDATAQPGMTRRIVEDREGNLWFGTFSGVVKYTRGGLTTYDQTSGLPDASVHLISETPAGELLVMHGTWRVSVLGPEGFNNYQLNLPESARFSWTSFPIVRDADGSLWSLQTGGLYRFPFRLPYDALVRQAPEEVLPDDAPNRDDIYYRGFFDRRGDFWLSRNSVDAARRTLLRRDAATGVWTNLAGVEGFPRNRIFASFAEDAAGNFWFGFYGSDGLARYANGRFQVFTKEDGLPDGATLALHVDAKGRLWIASNENGLTRVDDPRAEKPQFARITENEGLSSDNVRCFAEDASGNLYVGTVRGVSVIAPETGRIRQITTADGLAADFVQAAYRDRRGALWFGTSNGLSKYDPSENRVVPVAAPFISDLLIAGNQYAVSEFGQSKVGGIEVGAAENNLQIGFFSVADPGTQFYQYKLEGAENSNWSAPTPERRVNFANLAPGNYRFLVRVVTPAGNAVEEPAEVSFRILPPFWQRWWFLAFAALIVAGAIFALDRYRVAKTHQVEAALRQSQESETRFRTLAETASDAILTIDSESTIVFINPALEKIFGYAAEEMIGQKLTILMPPEMASRHEAGLGRYLATKRRHIPWAGVELPGRHKEGHTIPLEVSFGEFEREGRRFFTGIIRDVSERRRAEEALQKMREERFRELERVRARIATDLHDDIGSSLTQIAVLSEVARNQAAAISHEPIRMPLERIKSVSRELVEAMSDVVWAINPQKDNLRDLVQRMRRFASDVCSGRQIHFELNAPSVETSLQLGANIRREVFAIYKETINNAVKYAEAARIIADFRIENESLVLQISDDGRGFDSEAILSDEFSPDKGGNGLVNMQRRARELGGECRIISFPGGGTTVLLETPLHAPDHAPASMGGDNGNGKH